MLGYIIVFVLLAIMFFFMILTLFSISRSRNILSKIFRLLPEEIRVKYDITDEVKRRRYKELFAKIFEENKNFLNSNEVLREVKKSNIEQKKQTIYPLLFTVTCVILMLVYFMIIRPYGLTG